MADSQLRISPTEAAQQAIEYTRSSLFPFRFERWLTLGFVAFLEQCGRSGGGNVHVPTNLGGRGHDGVGFPGSGTDFAPVTHWVGSHVALVAALAALVLTLIVALSALVIWLGSRGIFMYLDNIATGRAEISRPWREHAERANSLFAWRFTIAIAMLLGLLLVAILGGVLFIGAWKGRIGIGPAVAIGLLVLLPLLLAQALAGSLLSVALRDFVAPLQWRLGVPCGVALRAFWMLLKEHWGAFVLYVVLKIAFSITLAIVAVIAGCVTCCCGFLPVVSQTLLQPLFFFERAWSLFILRQLGHDLFAPQPSAPPTV